MTWWHPGRSTARSDRQFWRHCSQQAEFRTLEDIMDYTAP